MKHNKRFVSGMLVMMLALSMVIIGCDNGTTTNNTPVTYSLSIAVADGSQAMGSVTITSGSPTGNAQGAGVTVTATPAADYDFVKWVNNSAGMGSVSTDNPYSFDINANTFLYAVFAPDNGTDGIINPEGTWNTDIGRGIIEATFTTEKTWTITLDSYSDSGTYTLDGNYGEIYSNRYQAIIGMFALSSDTTMTMYLVAPNPVTGTFHGIKQTGPYDATRPIVCLGDSLTAGMINNVDRPENSWPTLLEEYVTVDVINAGVSGDTTADALLRLEGDVLSKNPQIVIIALGGNDLSAAISSGDPQAALTTIKNNLQTIINEVKIDNRKLYLVNYLSESYMSKIGQAMQYSPAVITQVYQATDAMYSSLAASNSIALIEDVISAEMANSYMSADSIHLNETGYEMLAANIFNGIEPFLLEHNLVNGNPNDDDNTDHKSITITGIDTAIAGQVQVLVLSTLDLSGSGQVAGGYGTISNGSAQVELENGFGAPWTGNGPYYLLLDFDYTAGGVDVIPGSPDFIYTNGKTIEELGIMSISDVDKIPKYTISFTSSSIARDTFISIPPEFYE